MGHVVHYRDASGETRLEDVGSLDEALRLVERRRNEDEVTEVRVLREVPIELRTYVRAVVVGTEAPAGDGPEPATDAVASPDAQLPATDAVATAAEGGDLPGAAVMSPPATPRGEAAAAAAEPRRSRFVRS